jgi:diguanylate cyclase (GGDEF)-like protein
VVGLRHRRLPRASAPRVPMVLLLVVLVLTPAAGLPVMGWLYVSDRLEQVRLAERLEARLRGLEALDNARVAAQTESFGMSIQVLIESLSPQERRRIVVPSGILTTSPQQLAVTTDGAFKSPAIDGAATLQADLTAARQAVTGTGSSRTAKILGLAQASLGYGRVITALQAQEQAALRDLSAHDLGAVGADTFGALTQIRSVGALSLLASEQLTLVSQLVGGGDAASTQRLGELNGAVQTALRTLPDEVSVALRPRAAAAAADPAIRAYQDAMSDFSQAPAEATEDPFLARIDLGLLLPAGSGAVAMGSGVSDLMAAAVREGVTAAQAAQDAASTRARTSLVGVIATLALTGVLLTVIGRLVQRRLRDLSASAERLSAGQLELMDVKGPREVASISMGLNDAVRALQEITERAESIARGDLTSANVDQSSPGPLGTALQASFRRVVDSINEREELQQQLAYDATHDALTGLLNRSEAERRLQAALERAATADEPLSLLFIDLDHFKSVNDSHGHHAGDQVLSAAAERLRSQVRPKDDVCRLGGDEFIAILHGTAADEAAATGNRLIQAIRAPIPYGEHDLRIGASVGVATWPDPAAPDGYRAADLARLAEELLGRADRAVYRAKAAGRNVAVS